MVVIVHVYRLTINARVNRFDTANHYGGAMVAKYSKSTHISESFQPGNGTKYDLCMIYNHESRSYVFCWLNAPSCGRATVLRPDGILHHTYLKEKLSHSNHADIAALLLWIERVTGREIIMPDGFDRGTGLYIVEPLVH